MSEPNNLTELAIKLRADLEDKNFILIFAYNRVGKTRLSMEFKDLGRVKDEDPQKEERDTLYFNAFTEDLFVWDNDLNYDLDRCLKMNRDSKFFDGFKELDLETRVYERLIRYADFQFKIDYDPENPKIIFSRRGVDNIKISRGEQNLFIWCVFFVIVEIALDGDEPYKGINYIYIDDPISSLDDGNAIAVACDLVNLLKDKNEEQIEEKEKESKKDNGKKIILTKTVISTHHGLFFNILCNEFGKDRYKNVNQLHLDKDEGLTDTGEKIENYYIRDIRNTPFSYHIAMLGELQNAINDKELLTYHFNILRGVMDTTAIFLGLKKFSDCIDLLDNVNDTDKALFERALNVASHGGYPRYGSKKMSSEEHTLFKNVFDAFLEYYEFDIDAFVKSQEEPQT